MREWALVYISLWVGTTHSLRLPERQFEYLAKWAYVSQFVCVCACLCLNVFISAHTGLSRAHGEPQTPSI